MVRKTIDMLTSGKTDAVDQSQFISDKLVLKAAPKIFKETCRINFEQTTEEIYNFVRGLSPYPAAWAEVVLPGQTEPVALKVFETMVEKAAHEHATGTVLTDYKKYIKVAVSDGFVQLKQIQAPGKKRMTADELLRGIRI